MLVNPTVLYYKDVYQIFDAGQSPSKKHGRSLARCISLGRGEGWSNFVGTIICQESTLHLAVICLPCANVNQVEWPSKPLTFAYVWLLIAQPRLYLQLSFTTFPGHTHTAHSHNQPRIITSTLTNSHSHTNTHIWSDITNIHIHTNWPTNICNQITYHNYKYILNPWWKNSNAFFMGVQMVHRQCTACTLVVMEDEIHFLFSCLTTRKNSDLCEYNRW